MCSTRDNVALPTLGFPIRASAGHWLFSASPRLIAAVHALHRLLVPRHPPCALTILTVILLGGVLRLRPVIPVSLATVQFSRSAKRRSTPTEARDLVQRAAGGVPVSQNSTACEPPQRELGARPCGLSDSVDMSSGRSRSRRAPRSSKAQATILRRSVPSLRGLPRKEVIQPQLPLRLPCSRWPPCRHGARTISSSSLLEAKPVFEQTALPRMPRTHCPGEQLMMASRNIEPPEIGISAAARVVDATTADALRLKKRS
jgi:hypothetical protein